jgi:hypothetical protein
MTFLALMPPRIVSIKVYSRTLPPFTSHFLCRDFLRTSRCARLGSGFDNEVLESRTRASRQARFPRKLCGERLQIRRRKIHFPALLVFHDLRRQWRMPTTPGNLHPRFYRERRFVPIVPATRPQGSSKKIDSHPSGLF